MRGGVILTAPPIWTPELWLPEWMATIGKRQVKPNGKRPTVANGKNLKYATGDEKCCCAGGCGDCASIDDISITLSGILQCTCVNMGGYYNTLTTNPNGTYTGFTPGTPPAGFDCLFTKSTSITVTSYSDSGCTTSIGTATAVISLAHRIADDKWVLEIGIIDATAFDGNRAFYAEFDGGFDVASVSGIANVATACGITMGLTFLGYFGTAEVEFICAA